MLKMSALSANTGTVKTLAPLLDCVIDNCLIKQRPLLNETSLQMVHVMNPMKPSVYHSRPMMSHESKNAGLAAIVRY